MSIEPFQSVFSRVARKYHLQGEFEAAFMCHVFADIVRKHCGEKLAGMVSAKYLKGDTLWVSSKNASAAQRLQLQAHVVLLELQKRFGAKRILALRIVQGN